MNINALSFRDLEYLLATARLGHFGKAAAQCHVSQPALSTQIKKIESQLDVQIFERTNRKVLITEKGAHVVAQVEKIMEEIKKLEFISLDAANNSILKLGAIASLGPYLMPYVLPKMKKSFSSLKLYLQEGLTEELIKQLHKGTLDAVLASPTFDETGLIKFALFWEPFILTLPKGHTLAQKKNIVVKDLHAEDMVLLTDGHCLKDQTLGFCAYSRGKTSQQIQATSIETLKQLVAVGAGYTLLPQLAVETNAKMDSILEYRSLEKKLGRQINLYCRKSYFRMEEIGNLVEFIKRNLPEGVL